MVKWTMECTERIEKTCRGACTLTHNNGLFSFINLLHDKSKQASNQNCMLHSKLQLLLSPYLSRMTAPCSSDLDHNRSVRGEKEFCRFARSVVAKRFHEADRMRTDNTMFESSVKGDRYACTTQFSPWFAKAMCFIRLIYEDDSKK